MPIFISYSHQDKSFVDQLLLQFARERVHVWIDKCELKVGDSIIDKIQDAIGTANGLIIVLSKSSVSSDWCRKEFNSALMRELEEKRVLVLPLLLEDCDIPLFLKEKKFADFRSNFDQGLSDTLSAIAGITSNTQGRIEKPEFHTDWGINWGTISDNSFIIQITFLDHGDKLSFSVITEVKIVCNEILTENLIKFEKQGVGWFGRLLIVTLLNEVVQKEISSLFLLKNSLPMEKLLTFFDEKNGFTFEAHISSRRLGVDTGNDIIIEWGTHLKNLLQDLNKELTEQDRDRLCAIREGRDLG